MSEQITIKTSGNTVRLLTTEQIDHLYKSICNLDGETAVALTMCKWNDDESVDWETLKDAVVNFYTNVELLRKEIYSLLK